MKSVGVYYFGDFSDKGFYDCLFVFEYNGGLKEYFVVYMD